VSGGWAAAEVGSLGAERDPHRQPPAQPLYLKIFGDMADDLAQGMAFGADFVMRLAEVLTVPLRT
jgi:hypothetical protein